LPQIFPKPEVSVTTAPVPSKKRHKTMESAASQDDASSIRLHPLVVSEQEQSWPPARRSTRLRTRASYTDDGEDDNDDDDVTNSSQAEQDVDDPEYSAVKEEEVDDEFLGALAAAAEPAADDVEQKPDLKAHVDVSYTGFSIFGKTLVCMSVPFVSLPLSIYSARHVF
jgi:hypothetical protein